MNSIMATPFTTLLLMQSQQQHFPVMSPHFLEGSNALDLCVRKRQRSLSPAEIRREQPPPPPPLLSSGGQQLSHEPPTSTMCFSSPGSHSASSDDTSDLSASSSDQLPDYTMPYHPTSVTYKAKVPRPFKAYPKDPLALAAKGAPASADVTTLGGREMSQDAYSEFRHRMLSQVNANHAGTNKNMRRLSNNGTGGNGDVKYLEMRRKNNEAAKRSRDARRAKEDEIAIRCAFLEQENLRLRYEVETLRSESDRLRGIIAYTN